MFAKLNILFVFHQIVCVCIFLIKIFFAHENYMGKVQERLDLFRSFFFPYQRTISY